MHHIKLVIQCILYNLFFPVLFLEVWSFEGLRISFLKKSKAGYIKFEPEMESGRQNAGQKSPARPDFLGLVPARQVSISDLSLWMCLD